MYSGSKLIATVHQPIATIYNEKTHPKDTPNSTFAAEVLVGELAPARLELWAFWPLVKKAVPMLEKANTRRPLGPLSGPVRLGWG